MRLLKINLFNFRIIEIGIYKKDENEDFNELELKREYDELTNYIM